MVKFKVLQTTYPMFGNQHYMEYHKLQVTDSVTGVTKVVNTKGDLITDKPRMFPNGEYKLCQYITFLRKPYEVVKIYSGNVCKLKLNPLF